jgi:predicted RecA/RadA family phage recombinase
MRRLRSLGVVLVVASLVPLALASSVPAAAVPQVTRTITLHAPSALKSSWGAVSTVGYGAAAAKLGTYLGGDGDGVQFGPSYGTQARDKTWWYLDVAKARLAHYSTTGTYFGQVKVPKKYLAQGLYLQYQNPQALKDGSIVLIGTTIGGAKLLVMSRSHRFTSVKLKRWVSIHATDGTYLYGFNTGDQTVRVNPRTGAITTVAWMRGQGGRRFNLSVGNGYLKVTRPGVKLKLRLVSAEHPGKSAYPQLEATMGRDGRLWILISALVELSPSDNADAAGLISVSPSGKVAPVQPVRTLTSAADPGDGLHLGIRYGSTKPWLMFIDTDAARVYRLK